MFSLLVDQNESSFKCVLVLKESNICSVHIVCLLGNLFSSGFNPSCIFALYSLEGS